MTEITKWKRDLCSCQVHTALRKVKYNQECIPQNFPSMDVFWKRSSLPKKEYTVNKISILAILQVWKENSPTRLCPLLKSVWIKLVRKGLGGLGQFKLQCVTKIWYPKDTWYYSRVFFENLKKSRLFIWKISAISNGSSEASNSLSNFTENLHNSRWWVKHRYHTKYPHV